MDQHWRRLINAQGGAPGLRLEDFTDDEASPPPSGVRRIKRPSRGQPAIYEDVDGVQFTVDELSQAAGKFARSTLRYRMRAFSRWAEIIEPPGTRHKMASNA